MFYRRLAAVLLLILVASEAIADRPNVVLIMSDDQGYGDFGVTGNEVIRTPNIDAMAARSASMSTFYVSPVCSATRASLMTGRYNYRTRVVDTWIGRSMMDTDEVTVAEVLKEAGYATGIFGKWHLGDCYPLRPNDQGFEESLVHRGGGLAQPSEPRENGRRYTDPILFRNGKQVDTKGYCTDVYFDAAMEFIEKSAEEKRSFFTYIATNAPHGPFHDVPEELRKEYMTQAEKLRDLLPGKPSDAKVDRMARIAAMITNIDDNVGRLQKFLDKHKLTDNTLVIYLVDNGPDGARYVGPYRGAKTGVHEGGIRSPLWMQWPGKLKAGYTRDELSAHIDLMPTILDACDVSLPNTLKIDGRSLLPVLEGKETTWTDRKIAIQAHRGDAPHRFHHCMIRDDRFKLVHPSGFRHEKFVGEPKFELYDLKSDPGETKNLAESHPDKLVELKKAYEKWFDDVSSTRPDNYAPPRIVLGTEHETTTVLTRQDWRSDTWGDASVGKWMLHSAAPAEYDIEVQFKPPSDIVELIVQFSGAEGMRIARTIDPSIDRRVVESMPLPKGDIEVQAFVKDKGDKIYGAYQLIFNRLK